MNDFLTPITAESGDLAQDAIWYVKIGSDNLSRRISAYEEWLIASTLTQHNLQSLDWYKSTGEWEGYPEEVLNLAFRLADGFQPLFKALSSLRFLLDQEGIGFFREGERYCRIVRETSFIPVGWWASCGDPPCAGEHVLAVDPTTLETNNLHQTHRIYLDLGDREQVAAWRSVGYLVDVLRLPCGSHLVWGSRARGRRPRLLRKLR